VLTLLLRLAVNAPEEEQTNLVAALREKILHTVQAARNPTTPPPRAELKLRNVNMFLNGLVSNLSSRVAECPLTGVKGP
jgi:DNA topoisomerase 2-associated protein PAT1